MTDKKFMTDDKSDENVKAIGPWKRTSKREVYDNSWINVSHQEVITPAGTQGVYGVIHFKHYALGIVPLDQHNNTWLVGQFRYALNEFSWEIPMGGGALSEPPLISAQRELQEETGLCGGDWQQLFKIHTSNSVTDEQGYVFMAENLIQAEQHLDPSEGDLIVKQLPFSDAVAMVLRGEITDAITMAALLHVDRLLNERD